MYTKRLVMYALVVAATALFCSDDSNPYVPDKVQVGLLSSRFTDGAAVSIFSTDTFRVELLLQAHVDSVGFYASENRYWPAGDTVIRKTSFAPGEWPWSFRFPVSFFDTGWTVVRAVAWRSDGVVVADSVRLHRISPLDQPDIVADPGQMVTLSTDSVEDYVMYVWRFATGDSVVNDRPSAAKLITGTSFTTGELYVRSAGIRSRPADPFQVVLADRKGPTITCLNDAVSADSSRIYTGSPQFSLRVRVQDAGSAIASVLINGVRSDSCRIISERQWECSKRLLLSGGAPMPAVVRAADSRGNVTLDTFLVVYDSTLGSAPQIVVYDLGDTTRVPSREITVRGAVSNLYGTDTVYLVLNLDGAPLGSTPALVEEDNDWSWEVGLEKPMGEPSLLRFTLEQRQSGVRDTVHELQRVVIFDTSANDRIPPTITEVTSRGVPVTDGYYASTSPLALNIRAFDQSGIAWVRIRGLLDSVTITVPQAGGYVGDVALVRGTAGNQITITACDIFDNKASESRLVYQNRAPRITAQPSSVALAADVEYRDSVGATDPDGDSLTITILIQSPGGTYQVTAGPGGVFAWTPAVRDTGVVTFRAQVSDGYPRTAECQWTALVTAGGAAEPPEFLTETEEFPATLVTGKDTLRIGLRIVQPLDSGTYYFGARILESGAVIKSLGTDTALRWAPQISDTGVWTLEVVVINGVGLSDTVVPRPVIRVNQPYQPAVVSFAAASGSVREDAGTYQIEVQLSKPSPTRLSVGYRVLWGQSGTTVDTGDIRLLGNRVVFDAGSSSAQIPVVIVDDSVVEKVEKFTMVLDSALPADSIVVGSQSAHLCYIVDNDTAAQIDTVFWIRPLFQFGPEENRDVHVWVGTSRPLSKAVQVDILLDGSATQGNDYKVTPLSIVIPRSAGQDTFVRLSIMDDPLCEPSTEAIRMTLKARTPGVVLRDSIFTYHILPSDTPCIKPVALVHGGNAATTIEQTIGRMIDSMGYPVQYLSQYSATMPDPRSFSAILVSGTVTSEWVGAVLKDAPTHVLCASLPNWVSMQLANAHDTGQFRATSLRLHMSWPSFPTTTVRISDLDWIQFSRRMPALAVLVASVETSGGVNPIGGGNIGPVTDTLRSIFQLPAVFGTGGMLRGRRCTFPMRGTQESRDTDYAPGWWRLLRACMHWTLYGTWPSVL